MRHQSIIQWPTKGLYSKASHGSKRQISNKWPKHHKLLLANRSKKEFMIIQSLFGDSMFFPLGILEAWDDEGPTGVEKWWVHIEKERKKKLWDVNYLIKQECNISLTDMHISTTKASNRSWGDGGQFKITEHPATAVCHPNQKMSQQVSC